MSVMLAGIADRSLFLFCSTYFRLWGMSYPLPASLFDPVLLHGLSAS